MSCSRRSITLPSACIWMWATYYGWVWGSRNSGSFPSGSGSARFISKMPCSGRSLCHLLEGEVNWKGVARALKKIGYQGWISVEPDWYAFAPERLPGRLSKDLDAIFALAEYRNQSKGNIRSALSISTFGRMKIQLNKSAKEEILIRFAKRLVNPEQARIVIEPYGGERDTGSAAEISPPGREGTFIWSAGTGIPEFDGWVGRRRKRA